MTDPMRKRVCKYLVIMAVFLLSAGCMDEDRGGYDDPGEVVRDYFQYMDSGDFESAVKMALSPEGEWIEEGSEAYDEMLLELKEDLGENGELIEINELDVVEAGNHKKEVVGENACIYNMSVTIRYRVFFGGSEESREENFQMDVVHLLESDRWGIVIGEDDGENAGYKVELRIQIFQTTGGARMTIDNEAGDSIYWSGFSINVEGSGISIPGGNFKYWSDGICMSENRTDVGDTEILEPVYLGSEPFRPEVGQVYWVEIIELMENRVVWASEVIVMDI